MPSGERLRPVQRCRHRLGMVRRHFSPRYHQVTVTENSTGRPAPNRSLRGGSFLCHDSYCNRYRVAARSSNTPDSSASNIGFQVARCGST
ncbi:SUMF1/EgtB/PvdO family nonheme iron enzyme [Bradyrhizobium sp. RDI18]|uniref:SUMF1/EgtB/PvdO family nonheme iron enzyme n=1 Tax=Bradyrhizobium sp. RDI18 TaxID=3367400 RepID=UPI0037164EEC